MLIDKRNRFATATALSTAGTGTSKLGEAIDLTVASQDLGEGTPLWLVVLCTTAITGGAASTLSIELVTAENEALSTNPVVLAATQTFDSTAIAVGTNMWLIALPKAAYKRWLGLRQVIGGAAQTAGKVDAFITTDASNWRAYAEANS